MSREILVTKTTGNTQYQLYRTSIMYPAHYNDYKGNEYNEEVRIECYGIVTIIFINQEQIYYDSGPLTPKNYKVNNLFHRIHRLGLNDLDEIRHTIWSEHAEWCRNHYGNPFSRLANQKLRKHVNKRLHKDFC